MAQFFTLSDYSMSLPVILLTLFALGILLMDLIIPAEWKWFNALTAFIGVLFSAAAVYVRIQRPLDAAGLPPQTAFMNAMLLDHFAVDCSIATPARRSTPPAAPRTALPSLPTPAPTQYRHPPRPIVLPKLLSGLVVLQITSPRALVGTGSGQVVRRRPGGVKATLE